jgi:hypothetical protein
VVLGQFLPDIPHVLYPYLSLNQDAACEMALFLASKAVLVPNPHTNVFISTQSQHFKMALVPK